ncbi:hypothetical protein C8035_v006054 [Colletotrichum spinosum]|uniref:Apple domain-containing protein n=1 Tax=Colletotrichum spinosum TaxID=1347390 RepID=A0A4R8Q481_9PEZI|nr:hypothetical protein C8035_v006054 [Colletotrichum spinosum]
MASAQPPANVDTPSSTSSAEPAKYSSGLMPAEYVGLEVAQNGDEDGRWQSAQSTGGNTYHAPYQDNFKTGASYDQQQTYSQATTTAPPYGTDRGEKRFCGIRATTFWLALLALIFLLGTIGASAAAGTIAQQYAGYVQTCETKLELSSLATTSAAESGATSAASATAAAAAASELSATTASSTAGATPTSFTSIPLPEQASSILGEVTTNCPNLSSENKTYTPPGSNLRFVRECGKNYPFNDLGYIPLTKMEDCINLCAALYVTTQSADGKCIGVAWVTAGKQGTDQNYCWLKSAKGSPDPKANVEAAWLTMT